MESLRDYRLAVARAANPFFTTNQSTLRRTGAALTAATGAAAGAASASVTNKTSGFKNLVDKLAKLPLVMSFKMLNDSVKASSVKQGTVRQESNRRNYA
nr:putative ORF1 [Marmot picobirnavirus]